MLATASAKTGRASAQPQAIRTRTPSGPSVVTTVDTNDPRARADAPNRYDPGGEITFDR